MMRGTQNVCWLTAAELARRGAEDIPPEMVSGTHLIYSSPATLAYNSPGAEGFGVKRAGLAVPGSVMLIVAPGCCGRNTSLISALPQYQDRFFYLVLDETDVVTGRHLRLIPQAVAEIVTGLSTPPTVVMLCITCVDALLGTDMERVCRQAEERAGLPVRPCYMYALTREGRCPPMVHVRQSVYSLLEKREKDPAAANLLGYFAPLEDDCELYSLLTQAGVRTVRELSRCRDFSEYRAMAEANFNLVLNPEARFAARDFEARLGIPSIELTRLYQPDKIHNQYMALGAALGVALDDIAPMARLQAAAARLRETHGALTFAVGECLNGDPFELSLALLRQGFRVSEIYGTLAPEKYVWLRHIARLSPETRVYSNLEPTMLYYDCGALPADVTLGKDAGFYHPDCPNLAWNQDVQPFGHMGAAHLYEAVAQLLEGGAV
ncbi:MAG: nitrogenase component 1 [Oscillospiraceae bacterium]|nr:nitrogenase component 1 [Oscillospiraceae bacterium]